MKYVVVTGGVVSGLGKGITISSIGVLLKAAGLHVTAIKIDPYLNIDAGTMSPFEHGEVYVLNDGGEADLDLGNYERFLDICLTRDHNITTGKVYNQVLSAERRGDYLGKTVQVVPHVTDAIQEWVERVSALPVASSISKPGVKADICLVEVGGTVGDIESLVFLEALRQFESRVGRENIAYVHVSLVPSLGSTGEQKTKPTQHSVKELRSVGISPNVIVCRSSAPLERGTCAKIGGFCQVDPSAVLSVHDVSSIYHVPLILHEQGIVPLLLNRLHMTPPHEPHLAVWRGLADTVTTLHKTVRIALVGKYTVLQDAYLSVIKSLQYAAIASQAKLVIDWVDSSALEPAAAAASPAAYAEHWACVRAADGILVPGGFGDRGVEGKIAAANYARTHGVPYFGICLGMQVAVIEYARNVCGLTDANSAEFLPRDSELPKVIVFMPEVNPLQLGGTMRLGARETLLCGREDGVPDLAHELYGRDIDVVWERHRHRYEVNTDFLPSLTAAGLHFTGKDMKQERMEIIELDRSVHPFYFATQYHPEFQSQPFRPSPPFHGFILAATKQLEMRLPLDCAGRVEKGLALRKSELAISSIAGAATSADGTAVTAPHASALRVAMDGAAPVAVAGAPELPETPVVVTEELNLKNVRPLVSALEPRV